MKPPELIDYLNHLDIQVWADGDQLRYNAPQGALTPDLRAQLVEHKTEILELLQRQASDSHILPVSRDQDLPLSLTQQGVWLRQQLEPHNPFYNMPNAIGLMGSLDIEVLERALNEIVRRHESLRTTFPSRNGRPVQAIAPPENVKLPLISLEDLPAHRRQAWARQLVTQEAHRPFDLAQNTFRVSLLKLAEQEHVLLVTAHHLVFDNWSGEIFIQEIKSLYEAFFTKQPCSLPELSIQYADFAHWQQEWLKDEVLESELTYWKNHLDGPLPTLELPTYQPRPAVQAFQGQEQSFQLPRSLVRELEALSQREGTTLFMTLLAAFYTLLHRYTNQEDIIVGTTAANRNRTQVEGLIGLFADLLVLRADLSGNPTFRQLQSRVREVTLEAYSHQSLPFEKLVQAIQPHRDLSYNPLFQVFFTLLDAPASKMELPGLILNPMEIDNKVAHYDLNLTLFQEAKGLRGKLEYDTALFQDHTITRMLEHFQTLLESIVAHPDQRLFELQLLTGNENQLLQAWNNTQAAYSDAMCLHDLFEAQVERTPDVVAIVSGGDQITYQALNGRANQLARYLRGLGVGPDAVVALCVERSVEAVIGILGILKAGGAYLPIDPTHPQERVKYMLDDCGVELLLGSEKILARYSFTALQNLQDCVEPIVVTFPRPQITALDELPKPDRTLVAYDEYHKFIGIAPAKHTISLQMSRGCPFRCLFCHRIWPKKQIVRSAENVFEEIRRCYDAGVKRFVFVDDVFNLNEKKSGRLLQKILDHNLDVQLFFPNGLRGDILTRDFIDLMVAAGAVNIDVALETASPRLQKLIQKNLDLDRFFENVEYITLKYPQVILELEMMLGFPTETEKEALLTLDFLKQFQWVHFPNLNVLKIFPNTDMYDLAIENGVSEQSIQDSIGLTFHELPDTLPFPKSFMRQYQARFMNEYFLLKPRLLQVLPAQMKVLTEDELIQKYDSYLPMEIKSFSDILQCAGISEKELTDVDFLDENLVAAPNFCEQIKKHFPAQTAGTFRLLLLDLSLLFSAQASSRLYDMVEAPLGLLYLMTFLNQEYGDQILGKIAQSRIDFDNFQALKRLLDEFQPQIIGIRTLSLFKDFFHKTVSLIKQWYPDVPVVAGGPYATSEYATLLADRNVDLAVLGEGEMTFSELIGKILAHDGKLPPDDVLEQIAGLAFVPRQTAGPSRKILLLDRMTDEFARQKRTNLAPVSHADNLAYVMYTSGSTGVPKGVCLPHRPLVNLLDWHDTVMPRGARTLQFASLGFDVSFHEIFSACCSGGTLFVINDLMRLDALELARFIQEHAVEKVIFPVVVLQQVGEAFCDRPHVLSALRDVMATGEQLCLHPPTIALFEQLENCALHNHYGPTESHVVTALTLPPSPNTWATLPSIGRPISNTQIQILDRHLQPVPIGVVGELYIGGVCLARGYFNRPTLTANKFIPDPFSEEPGARLYKTGDLSRYLLDGNIEFLGRIDHQVKIRGHRVEPGEIEVTLCQHPDVQEAVVIVREDAPGDKQIVAYLVSDQQAAPGDVRSDVRSFLKERLPNYLIPVAFTWLDKIPLNANGKVDRGKLPAPEIQASQDYVAPRSDSEAKLVTIWREILGVERPGIDDDFFDLGGHSLKAAALVSEIHKAFEVKVPLKEIFAAPTIRGLGEFISTGDREPISPLLKVEEREHYPLSGAQRRIFILQQIDKRSIAYNLPGIYLVEGDFRKEKVERVFRTLLSRHEALRTSFSLTSEGAFQRVHAQVDWNIHYFEATEKEIESIAYDFFKPFALSTPPLFRVGLIQLDSDRHILLIDMHHIIGDGVSIGVLIREFVDLYEGKTLGEVKIQYKDYAIWHNRLINSEKIQPLAEYWLEKFSDGVPILNLPTDYRRPALVSSDGGGVEFVFDAQLTDALRAIASEHGTTLYTVLLTLYSILLSRYTEQDDFVIGSPVSGRTHPELGKTVGVFVNMMPIRYHPTSQKLFSAYLGQVKEQVVAALENQDYPFDMLVDQVCRQRDTSRNPLVETIFDWWNYDDLWVQSSQFKIKPYDFETHVARFDLLLDTYQVGQETHLTFEYSTQLFHRETVERMAAHYAQIARQVTENPTLQLGQIQMLTAAEVQQIIWGFNDAKVSYPDEATVQQIIEQQVEARPDKVAVIFKSQHLTYQALNAKANQLAWRLREAGLKRGDTVCVLLDRSPDIIGAILAILKAGGAYVPVDPDYPPKRIRFILNDAGSPFVLTAPSVIAAGILDAEELPRAIDVTAPDNGAFSTHNPPRTNTLQDTAYVVYTSGTSGNPKGAMVSHANLLNASFAWRQAYRLDQMDLRVLQVASPAFDLFSGDFVRTFTNGGCMILCALELLIELSELYDQLWKHKISFLESTPALVVPLMDYIYQNNLPVDALETLVIGSDIFNRDDYARLLARFGDKMRVINSYGVTEATVDSSYYEAHSADALPETVSRGVPIGRPFPNVRLYVLNADRMPQPVGVPGELCVGGKGVAKGYLGRPELDQERFVPNPFIPGETMYRTGDYARWLPDGTLEFFGRRDFQVKVGGYRIEIGEIETNLLRHAAVKEAVVVDCLNRAGQKYLVAYVTLNKQIEPATIRQYLLDNLPGYMVPHAIRVLETIPLTPNGKVDRKALMSHEKSEGLQREEYVPPRSETETVLAGIWQEILGVPEISVADSFFELGGNSLSLLTLYNRVSALYNTGLSVAELFSYHTIEMLANRIERGKAQPEDVRQKDQLTQDIYAILDDLQSGQIDITAADEAIEKL